MFVLLFCTSISSEGGTTTVFTQMKSVIDDFLNGNFNPVISYYILKSAEKGFSFVEQFTAIFILGQS